MAIRFEQSFAVKAPPDAVWAYLTDPNRIAAAVPGAAITEKVDERTWKGTITVKVGPVSAKYRGTVRFEKLDAAARVAEVSGVGQEATGKGGADMRMTSRLVEKAPGETQVSVASDVNVTGILAQFGRGMIQDVSDQMFRKFADAVRGELESAAAVAAPAPAPAQPIEVLSFGGPVAARALARAAKRPVFWIAAAVFLLILVALFFR
jgi:carbon monoxide dehydrogenase subunit G